MSSVDGAPRKRGIPCVYCAGEHQNAAELKDCWQRNQGKEVAGSDDLPPVESYDDGGLFVDDSYEFAPPPPRQSSVRPSAPSASSRASSAPPATAAPQRIV
ncbi:MAG: hypothetical protein ABMA25_26770, partial [Ilumatobacteraceae bacterium]